jgi:hypothetical protein
MIYTMEVTRNSKQSTNLTIDNLKTKYKGIWMAPVLQRNGNYIIQFGIRGNKMPLKKGAKPGSSGFKSNIRAEIAAGKPQRQALAIAYSESGEKKKGKKKVAKKR